jgi:5-deoxy-glucuronate isomerase
MMNNESDFLVRSTPRPGGGDLLSMPREKAKWEWMSFFVHKLMPGQEWKTACAGEEAALIILGGRCVANWGEGDKRIGERKNVFDGLPYSVYMPSGTNIRVQAETELEFAECRVPSNRSGAVTLITPEDVKSSLRGGGNASRQIVDVMPPDFPADKLVLVEVYTPSGNWSSFHPHKHDVHNPPTELDLDEIYYYRIDSPDGFAHQRLYTRDGSRNLTLTVHDQDMVLVRDGYHPVVAGHGYNVYYLNCLAGSARGLSATEDPDHVWVKSTWKDFDPRVPIVKPRSA